MLNVYPSTFSAVVDQALKDAADHPRWLNAINRATIEVLSNPYIERGDHGLIIGSPSGKCYAANGICQCTAFEYGQACWHRAAARLVRLHDEHIASQRTERSAELDEYERYLAERTERWAQAKAEIDADQAQRRAAYDQAVAEMDELFA